MPSYIYVLGGLSLWVINGVTFACLEYVYEVARQEYERSAARASCECNVYMHCTTTTILPLSAHCLAHHYAYIIYIYLPTMRRMHEYEKRVLNSKLSTYHHRYNIVCI